MPTPIVLALTLLIEPQPGSSAVSCADVGALLDLGEADQATFESLCSGSDASDPEREQLRLSLDRLLRIGDWRATLAMRTLADSTAKPPAESPTPAKLDLATKFSQCVAIDGAITQYLQDVEFGRFPKQVGLDILRNDKACAKQLNAEEATQLADSSKSNVLITWVGDPKDSVAALILDPSSRSLVRTSPVIVLENHPGLRFVLVPRGQRVLFVVHQVEHDLAWTETRTYNRNATLARRDEIACIDAKLTIDDGVDAAIVIDGQVLDDRLIERRSGGAHDRVRTVVNVPPGEHDLLMVVHGVNDDGTVRQLTIPEAIEARLSVERKVATNASSCTAIEHDLHGLKTNQSRYGIARITVDEQCETAGLWSPRVRQHVEEYARLLEPQGVRLEQLDAWSEALAEFQLLQQGDNANEGLFDDRKRTSELAETVMRQGVDYLLFFELRCDAEADEVDVFGTSIDLRSYSLRDKSDGVTETRGLRDSRLHTAPRVRAREAIDVVLGDLFGVGHVMVTGKPTGSLDEGHYVRVALEHPDPRNAPMPELEVSVFRVTSDDVCDQLDSITSLERDASLAEMHRIITGSAYEASPLTKGSKRRSSRRYGHESRDEWELFDDRLAAAPWKQEFNVTGLPTGTYVAWIADLDAQRYDARCFEVEERTFEYWVAINAGTRTRGGEPAFNPRYDQVNHLRLTSGLRVHSPRYFAAGALLGYEHASYEASTTPSWDDFDDVVYASDGSVDLEYARNGMLIGAFAGVDVPFCVQAGCNVYLRRMSWFVEAALMGNLGFLDARNLPASLSEESSRFDPDLDVTLQGGVRILATSSARFGIVLGSHWTDVAAIAASSRLPAGHPHAAASLTFDYAWRWTLGFELSLSRRTR